MVKNIIMRSVISLVILLSAMPCNAFSHQSYYDKSAKEVYEQGGNIDSLNKALFSKTPDFNMALTILKRIRQRRNDDLLIPLNNIYDSVKRINRGTNYERRTNPFLPLQYQIEASLISLELYQNNTISSDDRYEQLIKRIEKKLRQKEVVNAEIILLDDISSSITDQLFNTFDKTPDTTIKIITLSVLNNSNSSIIEREVLKRIDNYNAYFSVYSKMLLLLGEKGGSASLEYLVNKIGNKNQGIDIVIKLSLEKLKMKANSSQPRKQTDSLQRK